MSVEEGSGHQMDPGPPEDGFLHWLHENSVEINGLRAALIPEKGRGIIATRKIKEGEKLVFVPVSAIVTVPRPGQQTQSKDAGSNKRPSVHAALALKLLLNVQMKDPKQSLILWWDMMPPLYVMNQCPLTWPEAAQKLLPAHARASLEQQKWRFQRDWAYFQSMKLSPSRFGAPPEESSEWMFNMFRFTWLLVNTRSFYWDYPTAAVETSKHQKKRKTATGSKQSSLPTDECMALVPFIDLFNHSYVGESCEVEFNNEGFTVTAGRDYESGEEVFVTYGNHHNESLIVEYGFMVEPNVCDMVSLDQYVIPEFNKAQKALLERNNLLGNYNLHASNSPSKATPATYCYRTQCALRVLTLPADAAQRFIDSGGDSEEGIAPAQQEKIHDMWRHICGHVFENVMKTKQKIEEELEEGATQEILLARWNQISDMVFETI